MVAILATVASLLLLLVPSLHAKENLCNITDFGAVADNTTDNSHVFRNLSQVDAQCAEIVVPPGVWLTGPFNLSSNTVFRV